ncbi:nuclear transport factor 2 family protein [Rhizobium sp. 0TCS1.26]|uniref:nuclear transport factor 2 family protein n=1 Tax=Rhizobium sp. 0TCS1.26 TaxID=3142623 RepID=UPI003D27CAFE
MPTDVVHLIKSLYDRFNARDMEAVLAVLADDVAWANAMDGGHAHGREAVRDYWTRQWAVVTAHVEPVTFETAEDGSVVVEVIQSVFDLNGRPLQGQSHGLRDKTVTHVFRIQGDRVVRFDIRDRQ